MGNKINILCSLMIILLLSVVYCQKKVTVSYSVGPFEVVGLEMQSFFKLAERPTGAIAITDITFDIIDQNNDSVMRSIYLHHYLLMALNLFTASCPEITDHRTIVGTGNELTNLHLPAPYAVVESSENEWGLALEILNLYDKNLTVYAQYNITYSTDVTVFAAATPFTLSVTGCTGSTDYNITGNGGKGSISVATNSTYRAPISGKIVYAYGHLHDGGYNVSILNLSTNTVICDSIAKYDNGNVATGNITSISQCYSNIWVSEGDHICISATYDNSKPWLNVMGMALSYIGS